MTAMIVPQAVKKQDATVTATAPRDPADPVLDERPATTTATAPATATAPPRTTGQKLRDCCQSCARSKVKCTKEKPSCSRCETKGIPCRYLQSKRPGRIPGSGARRSNPANTTRPKSRAGADTRSLASPQPRQESNPADDAAASTHNAAALLSPSSTAFGTLPVDNTHQRADSLFDTYYGATHSPDIQMDGDQDLPFVWDGYFDVLGTNTMDDPTYANMMDWDSTASPLDMSLPFPATGPHGDSLPLCGSMPQSPASRLLPTTSLFPSTNTQRPDLCFLTSSSASSSSILSSTSMASSSSSSSSSLFSDYSTLPTTIASPTASAKSYIQHKSASSVSSVDQNQREHSTPSSCICLDKALDLLKAVTKDPCPDPSRAHSKSVTQAILAKNKETIQATLAILACESCMEDRLLIMVALLIAMEMLPRYASAAALTGLTACLSDDPRTDNILGTMDPRPHDQNLPRQAKLQVLRELHLVQRLITQLSSRLKGLSSHGRSAGSLEALLGAQSSLQRPGSRNAPQKGGMSTHSSNSSVCSDNELMPISTRTLDLVEDDVRNSLSSLSAVVRNALKQS
ncbi:Fungal Zn binuclear cluster domain containing protein [Pyrenophora tritici-repentis]|uniref:Fungal Zn binuclear cluster domain containing protein n=2 Tax=Pyrenophora tritici-repentis TaxID=45151 RepID=A0A922NMS9_9PLEO|nr:C6 zinc finger domain containing protein [Pyrenophora tritici-repentis Pt-1C-BFP]EDU45251.1 C6 zinc finger domain containing protein [Pyrenophora tritici-repentis Pt-1C-BFP]KAI1518750.1 Fungal Zn binuclear cluster domain containing protein [Pyrenophora tritici-repentis]KAI1672301.1 Fungal Zn binuclear cluster domain containing protein [Pyrenophora tritici-repentis]KAI1686324.1 Fungal Zn binuclear cluster domain containing protein [Pyrenophora tritici-repentis]